MKKPLYTLNGIGRNYQIGDLLNGRNIPHEGAQAECRCSDVDYSQFSYPLDWHACLGYGGNAGGFHQGCGPGKFQPNRLKVIPDPDHEGINILECQGGTPNYTGKWELAKWFDNYQEVYHASGEGILLEWNLMWMGDEGDIPYVACEGRGRLNFIADKNESVEGMGVHLMRDKLMVAYWRDAIDGSRVDQKRMEIKTEPGEFTFVPGIWHRLNVEMVPLLDLKDTWAAHVQIRTPGKTAFEWRSTSENHPNNVISVSQLCFGDERERDSWGGRMRVRRSMAWRLLPERKGERL